MNRFFRHGALAAATFVLATGLSAGDNATSSTSELAAGAMYSSVAGELSLTASQSSSIGDAFQQHALTPGFTGSDRRHGVSSLDSVLNLTTAQQTQLQALHTAFRTAAKALKDQRKAGTVTEEAFHRQMIALNAKLTTDGDAVLTAAQRAALPSKRC